MQIDLHKKSIGVFGNHECGKSHFLKSVAENYNSVVFDPLQEYNPQKHDVYRPKKTNQDYLETKVDSFVGDVKDTQKHKKKNNEELWKLLIFSEVSSYISNNHYGGNINQFLNYYRHTLEERGWELGFAYDARRPSKVSADMREVTKYFACFGGIKGHNDIKALNNMNKGLGDAVKNLDTPFDQNKGENHNPYEFILVYPDRSWEKFDPI